MIILIFNCKQLVLCRIRHFLNIEIDVLIEIVKYYKNILYSKVLKIVT